jgi:hypothetical protein
LNNEPVAWMLLGLEDRKPKLINLQVIEHLEGTWIPLYTDHVWTIDAKYKNLTDEEIVNLYKETEADNGGIREFARAILRKAQEK